MENFELNEEEKRIIEKHQILREEAKQEKILFWQNEYKQYSREQKKRYWLPYVHHGMRIQGEATGDEYSEFSYNWYKDVKSKEPDFDSLFLEVVPLLGFEFDWAEYQKRIRIIKPRLE